MEKNKSYRLEILEEKMDDLVRLKEITRVARLMNTSEKTVKFISYGKTVTMEICAMGTAFSATLNDRVIADSDTYYYAAEFVNLNNTLLLTFAGVAAAVKVGITGIGINITE